MPARTKMVRRGKAWECRTPDLPWQAVSGRRPIAHLRGCAFLESDGPAARGARHGPRSAPGEAPEETGQFRS